MDNFYLVFMIFDIICIVLVAIEIIKDLGKIESFTSGGICGLLMFICHLAYVSLCYFVIKFC